MERKNQLSDHGISCWITGALGCWSGHINTCLEERKDQWKVDRELENHSLSSTASQGTSNIPFPWFLMLGCNSQAQEFMNPMSTYEWNLMARCSSLHLLFVHHLLALALFLFNFLFFIIFTAKGFGDGYLLNSYSLQQILTHIIVYRLGGWTGV